MAEYYARAASDFEDAVAEAATTHGVDAVRLRQLALQLAAVSAFSPTEAVRQIVIGLKRGDA